MAATSTVVLGLVWCKNVNPPTSDGDTPAELDCHCWPREVPLVEGKRCWRRRWSSNGGDSTGSRSSKEF
ncbi:hypothetical protein ZHAS_00010862 [Anopheles sinensis]|uniref:Uncharacterized protein n=1 Tax=Anopheles sinensis TaxID=74873 RepID=A0A084VYE2_ANOSI|nr:hypothetical protein ZHAS_00010862 [Anopheles sinensis]